MKSRLIAMCILLASVAACSPKSESGKSGAPEPEAAAPPVVSHGEPTLLLPKPDVSSFLGKWTGPEGTSLTIAKAANGEDYDVTIVNLDGPRTFTGAVAEGGIQITRDNAPFLIHKGSGDEAGMKWLAGKNDCLIVTPGEGFCKD